MRMDTWVGSEATRPKRAHDDTGGGRVMGAQTVKPPPKFKKKTVYFLKTSPAKVDNDNLKKIVRTGCSTWRTGSVD